LIESAASSPLILVQTRRVSSSGAVALTRIRGIEPRVWISIAIVFIAPRLWTFYAAARARRRPLTARGVAAGIAAWIAILSFALVLGYALF
jgi:hypothetical protein